MMKLSMNKRNFEFNCLTIIFRLSCSLPCALYARQLGWWYFTVPISIYFFCLMLIQFDLLLYTDIRHLTLKHKLIDNCVPSITIYKHEKFSMEFITCTCTYIQRVENGMSCTNGVNYFSTVCQS